MKSQVLHTVWWNISGEAVGEIWNWSLLGVKGLSILPRSVSGTLFPQLFPAQQRKLLHFKPCGLSAVLTSAGRSHSCPSPVAGRCSSARWGCCPGTAARRAPGGGRLRSSRLSGTVHRTWRACLVKWSQRRRIKRWVLDAHTKAWECRGRGEVRTIEGGSTCEQGKREAGTIDGGRTGGQGKGVQGEQWRAGQQVGTWGWVPPSTDLGTRVRGVMMDMSGAADQLPEYSSD